MNAQNPTKKYIYFSLTLLLLINFIITIKAYDSITSENNNNDDGDDDFEELMALDEDEIDKLELGHGKSSEADVLSKAQKVVLELDIDNTKRVIDGKEFVIVLGYAPWCVRSAELMPQFAEAAMVLKGLGSLVLMAKLDAERYPKVAESLEIKGFPTLLLFVNGSVNVYNGGFTAEDIVIWARKKTGVPVIRLNSVIEADDFLKKYPLFVIGMFNKFEGDDYEEFINAAISDNEIQFVETSNIEIAKVLYPDIESANSFIGLVKSEPERFTIFEGSFKTDKILKFLDYNKFPLVNVLTELNSAKVYSSSFKLQVYVFADANDFKNLVNSLQDSARKFLSEIMFVLVDIKEENLAKPFLTLFGLEDSEETAVTAFDNRIGGKYLLEADPTPSTLKEFCMGLVHQTLSPYYKSQPIPDNIGVTVQIVVGKTFNDLVLSSRKNVLLEVHAPWCINCETTSKQIEKLAKHFKGLESLIFARIDASTNEHPKLKVEDYPTLLFYPASDKSKPIKLSAKSGLKELAASINKIVKSQNKPTKDEL